MSRVRHRGHAWEAPLGELCARCTPESDHNGVLCRRCADREIRRLRDHNRSMDARLRAFDLRMTEVLNERDMALNEVDRLGRLVARTAGERDAARALLALALAGEVDATPSVRFR